LVEVVEGLGVVVGAGAALVVVVVGFGGGVLVVVGLGSSTVLLGMGAALMGGVMLGAAVLETKLEEAVGRLRQRFLPVPGARAATLAKGATFSERGSATRAARERWWRVWRAAWGVARALTEATTESARTRHFAIMAAAGGGRRKDWIYTRTRRRDAIHSDEKVYMSPITPSIVCLLHLSRSFRRQTLPWLHTS
jgi:hypothetical protein